jgi:SAM-dependent methyltransferase
MLREDGEGAYPVVDDIPILLAPEMLTPGDPPAFDLRAAQYAEAYAEREFYDEEAEKKHALLSAGEVEQLAECSQQFANIELASRLSESTRDGFPEPLDVWVDATYDSEAQADAYRHVAPVRGRSVLQLGGSGGSSVMFLLAGARQVTVISPMLAELRYGRAVAQRYGIAERMNSVVAVAEELPFPDRTFDAVYAGGTVHHMTTELAMPEASRVLRRGGRFAAIEPWRAPGYSWGTRIFGKREANPFCRPLESARMAPFFAAFDEAEIVHHGTLTRYPLIVLGKAGIRLRARAMSRLIRLDDAICSKLPALRAAGSSVALLAAVSPGSEASRA